MTNFWTNGGHSQRIDPQKFRGHDQYLEQSAGYPFEALERFLLGQSPFIFEITKEDDAFGCVVHRSKTSGKILSRDLLDSCCELLFLSQLFLVMNLRVLDIGAGYGRLAHRMTELWGPSSVKEVVCTDAVAVSRECCARYLKFRGAEARTRVLAPDEVRSLGAGSFDLAINVHSFSECSMADVSGWLAMLSDLAVPRIFIIPHNPSFGVHDLHRGGGNGPSYLGEMDRHGYRLAWRWEGPEACPRTYALFERRTS